MSQKDIDKLEPKDKPYMSNYPALKAWVVEHDGYCMTQTAFGVDYFERWMINGRVALIEIRARSNGWEIWTACNSINTEETLADAERRLGINAEYSCRVDGCKNRSAIGLGGYCQKCSSELSSKEV